MTTALSPGPLQYVVEADGGSRGNPGVAGYGALVRDRRTGRVLAQRAEPLGTASNNVAEYSGLIAGLELALRLAGGAPLDVEVRMDSKLVVEQMSGRWKVKHEDMRRLAETARQLVARIVGAGGGCRFAWVPRARNGEADRLSNLAMDGRRIDRLMTGAADVGPGAPSRIPGGDDPSDDTSDDDPSGDDTRDDDTSDDDTSDDTTTVEAQAVPARRVEADAVDVEPPGRTADPVGATIVTPEVAPRGRRRPPDRSFGARLVLARHAVTDATAAGRMDGRGGPDLPLNAEGTRQAQLLAAGARAFLGPVRPIVIVSGLRRAQETGRLVAATFDTSVEVDRDWDELHFGDWNGRTMREIWTEDPQGLTGLLADPASGRPGGESRADLAQRVARAVATAVRRAREVDAPVLVVTHRGPIVAALAHLLRIGPQAAGAFETGPASLTSIRRWSDDEVLVEFVNDRSHLRPARPPSETGRAGGALAGQDDGETLTGRSRRVH